MRKYIELALALPLALLAAASAPGVPTVATFPPDAFLALSAESDAPARPAVVSVDSERAATILGRLPAALFDVETNRLTALSFSFAFESPAAPAAPLVLHALTNAYDPAATWTLRVADTPWRRPGGDSIARYAVTARVERAAFDVPAATSAVYVATFDLLELFHQYKQGPFFRENGFLVAFAPGDSAATANARADLFPSSPATPADALPAVRAIWCDPFLDLRDYAISGISNGPFHKPYATNATDETVYWEQDLTTVGRVMLNETNGFESRAILSMPKSLLPIDPDRIQSVECHFQCYENTWNGEDIVLRPVTSPTRLEMAGNRPDNGANPTHGPSWRWADGPVDTNDLAYPRLPWTTPGGDMSPKYAVHALLDAASGGWVDDISFDLTPLWLDPEARALLSANGAIVYADPDTWTREEWVAVQIYCSDDYTVAYKSANSTFRVTLHPPFAPPSGAPAAAFALLSEADPDAPSPVPPSSPLPALALASNAETRLAVRFDPSLFAQDPRQADGIRLFLPLDASPDPDALSRLVLQPLFSPFDPATATWNSIGDTLPDALPAVLSEYATGLYFDLAPLLASPATSNALAACGALLRLLPDPSPAPASRDSAPIPDAPDAPSIAFSATQPPLPLLLATPLHIRNPSFAPAAFSFDAYGLDPAASYALDATPSLTAPDWTPVLSPLPSDTPTIPLSNAPPAAFFRLRRLP